MINQTPANLKNLILSSLGLLLVYWFAVAIIPFLMFYFVKDENNVLYNLIIPVFLLIMLISPFLFIIPYKMAIKKLEQKWVRILFVVGGAIIPYIIIYTYVINAIMHMGAPRF